MSLKPFKFFAFFASFFDAGLLVICSYIFRASTVVQISFEPLFDPIDFYDTAIAKHHTTECVYEKKSEHTKNVLKCHEITFFCAISITWKETFLGENKKLKWYKKDY